MPDHYHFLLKVIDKKLFSKFVGDFENSFTRYFNLSHKRRGPLWQSRFRRVKIKNNEQLLHVSRYIHLNPTTNKLVEKPEDWKNSSYVDYVKKNSVLKSLKEISIRRSDLYRKFCEDQQEYQKKLKIIKRLLLE